MKKIVVFFADGFEECEGLLVVDLLRRADVNVITACKLSERGVRFNPLGVRREA